MLVAKVVKPLLQSKRFQYWVYYKYNIVIGDFLKINNIIQNIYQVRDTFGFWGTFEETDQGLDICPDTIRLFENRGFKKISNFFWNMKNEIIPKAINKVFVTPFLKVLNRPYFRDITYQYTEYSPVVLYDELREISDKFADNKALGNDIESGVFEDIIENVIY